jgi:signal transduction histidine kinase
LLRAAQPDGDLAALWVRLSAHGDLVLETEHPCRDGGPVPVEVSLRAFQVAEARCIQTMVRDISERKSMEQERERQAAHLAALSHRLISVQEDERRRLSAELHQRTSPNMAALDINLRSLAGNLPPDVDSEALMLLDDAAALLADTADSLREVSADLRPPVLDYAGLLPALQSYVHQFSNRTGVAVDVDCPGLPTRFETEVESTLFRIAQEALSNCAKHAKARQVRIALEVRKHQVTMEIADDGVGFATSTSADGEPAASSGLLSMRERAEFAGGSLRVDSSPGRGTRLSVSIPVSRASKDTRHGTQPSAQAQSHDDLSIDIGRR